jgi:hypothetical protein
MRAERVSRARALHCAHLRVEVAHGVPRAQRERQHLARVRSRVLGRDGLGLAQDLALAVRNQVALHAAHERDARERLLDGRLWSREGL